MGCKLSELINSLNLHPICVRLAVLHSMLNRLKSSAKQKIKSIGCCMYFLISQHKRKWSGCECFLFSRRMSFDCKETIGQNKLAMNHHVPTFQTSTVFAGCTRPTGLLFDTVHLVWPMADFTRVLHLAPPPHVLISSEWQWLMHSLLSGRRTACQSDLEEGRHVVNSPVCLCPWTCR